MQTRPATVPRTRREPTTAPISSPEAEARVRRYYACVDAGDVPGLIALFAPDAQYHRPGYEPLVGHADLQRFYRGERVIAEGRHTVSELLVAGSQVAVHGEFHGVLHSGERVGLRFADFFRLTAELAFARRDTFFFAPLV